MLKARDDGATYGANPASLDDVTVEKCDFYDNERGIRVGEPGKDNATPTNVNIFECNIYNNVNCSAGGSAYGDLVVLSQASVLAVTNWWGTPTEPLTVSGRPLCAHGISLKPMKRWRVPVCHGLLPLPRIQRGVWDNFACSLRICQLMRIPVVGNLGMVKPVLK